MKTLNSFLMMILLTISTTAKAGAVKELVIDHESSIASEVEKMGPFTVNRIFDTRFVKANAGFEIAIESQVEVLSHSPAEIYEIACTSQFKKGKYGSMEVFETNCEFPE